LHTLTYFTSPSTALFFVFTATPTSELYTLSLHDALPIWAQAFAEKPEASTARTYVNSGRYRWNAGMFIAKAASLLEVLAEEDPALFAGLSRIAEAWDTPDHDEVLDEVW